LVWYLLRDIVPAKNTSTLYNAYICSSLLSWASVLEFLGWIRPSTLAKQRRVMFLLRLVTSVAPDAHRALASDTAQLLAEDPPDHVSDIVSKRDELQASLKSITNQYEESWWTSQLPFSN